MRKVLSAASLASALAFVALSQAGCTIYSDDLQRSVRYYDSNEHERALAVLRSLEPDLDSLKPDDRIRYYYYRGMTDFRLANDTYKVRPDARHWLALAKASNQDLPQALTDEQKQRLDEALDDLNRDVYGGADDSTPVKSDDKAKSSDKKKSSDDDDAAPKKKKNSDSDDDTPKKKKKKSSDDN
jgi:hypothetical protein